ncbi:MAG: EamA family transporter, partial [Candidatus Solibacter sp.]
ALGVVLLVLWQLSRMALLSWADLSYVVPVTSVGYVVVALIGKVLLDEDITGRRWAGIVLIMAGVALVGRSAPSTVPRGESR